jgi:uncharacterized FAD-dependent dehydrogenase
MALSPADVFVLIIAGAGAGVKKSLYTAALKGYNAETAIF